MRSVSIAAALVLGLSSVAVAQQARGAFGIPDVPPNMPTGSVSATELPGVAISPRQKSVLPPVSPSVTAHPVRRSAMPRAPVAMRMCVTPSGTCELGEGPADAACWCALPEGNIVGSSQ